MLRFFRRRAFRSEVRTHLSYLLGFVNDDVLQGLLRTYPGIWRAVDTDFLAGETAMTSAIKVLAITLTNEIEQRKPSDQARLERYLLHNEGEPKSGVERGMKPFLARLRVQKDAGNVTDKLYEYTISEIFGALQGITDQERAAHRIVTPLLRSSTEPS
jgi:hypothetical protein